jgi:hypothetical protein
MTEPEKKFDADTLIPIIGLIALVFVIILLLSTPGMLLAKQVSVIDTELSRASGHETSVKTKMDFGDNAHVQALPTTIGDWQSIIFDTSKLAESLGAEVMLLRAYGHTYGNGTLRGKQVLLLIIQSDNRSSFHPPIVCYPAVGYRIEEETTEEIRVSNATWAEAPWYPNVELEEPGIFNGSMSAKKLVISKESDGEVTKRKVVLYFYVKDNTVITDKITMIRVSAYAPINGSYEGALNLTKDFMGEVVPYMFEIREEEEITAVQLAKSGIGGWLIIGALVSVPIGIIVYPRIKNRKRNKGSR